VERERRGGKGREEGRWWGGGRGEGRKIRGGSALSRRKPRRIVNCPCCGGEMKKERDLGRSLLVRCASCGLSDTVVH